MAHSAPGCVLLALLLSSIPPTVGSTPYGPPSFSSLSVSCDSDGPECRGSVCDWLAYVAHRGNLTTLESTREFVSARLGTLTSNASAVAYLRLPAGLFAELEAHYRTASCPADWAPRQTPYRPWRACFDGRTDPENHHELVNTGLHGVQVMNVHAAAPGAERFHHHQLLSIFIHWGFPMGPCAQRGYRPDGTVEPDATCNETITPATAKTLEVLFVGTQWLHANYLKPPMAFPNARNCPHALAPASYGPRGFMMRVFFPMGEADVEYPITPVESASHR